MSRFRFVLLGTVLVLAALTGACGGEPPEKEMQQAQGAIDAARAAGAPDYAAAEFNAAVTALERARRAATDRDYRQALNDALDARDRAQTSAREAADNMATTRVAADRAVAAAAASVDALQKRFADLEAAKAPVKALAGPRQQIDELAVKVQEARTAFDKGQYAAATDGATAAATAIADVGRQLDGVTTALPRRAR